MKQERYMKEQILQMLVHIMLSGCFMEKLKGFKVANDRKDRPGIGEKGKMSMETLQHSQPSVNVIHKNWDIR